MDDRIDTLEAILRMMGSVLPPPELLDIHVQMAVILEQVTFLNKVAQADEQGESDGSFARMLIASGYLQLTDAALAAERAMDDLDPATARVLNENGCTVASP